jgi:hypothetical protein
MSIATKDVSYKDNVVKIKKFNISDALDNGIRKSNSDLLRQKKDVKLDEPT